jgi:hypothetical protein
LILSSNSGSNSYEEIVYDKSALLGDKLSECSPGGACQMPFCAFDSSQLSGISEIAQIAQGSQTPDVNLTEPSFTQAEDGDGKAEVYEPSFTITATRGDADYVPQATLQSFINSGIFRNPQINADDATRLAQEIGMFRDLP